MQVMRSAMLTTARGVLPSIRDRIELIRPGDEIVSGIETIDAPGHLALLVSSGGERLLHVVRLFTPLLSLPRPPRVVSRRRLGREAGRGESTPDIRPGDGRSPPGVSAPPTRRPLAQREERCFDETRRVQEKEVVV